MIVNFLASKRFWVTSFAVSCIGVFLILRSLADDPCRDQIMNFVSSSEQLTSQLGAITNAEIHRIVTMQDAISVQDEFRPGFRRYELVVRGARARALVTIETGLKSCTPAIKAIGPL